MLDTVHVYATEYGQQTTFACVSRQHTKSGVHLLGTINLLHTRGSFLFSRNLLAKCNIIVIKMGIVLFGAVHSFVKVTVKREMTVIPRVKSTGSDFENIHGFFMLLALRGQS